jgi:coenzyme F420-reducing hydrogenase alpha subunit
MSKTKDIPNYLWVRTEPIDKSGTREGVSEAHDPFRRRDKMDDKKVKENKRFESDEFLKHPRVKSVKQRKLINDTAYFLHHPQVGAKGPKMPPKKPKG